MARSSFEAGLDTPAEVARWHRLALHRKRLVHVVKIRTQGTSVATLWSTAAGVTLLLLGFAGSRGQQPVLLEEFILLHQPAEDPQQADQVEALADDGEATSRPPETRRGCQRRTSSVAPALRCRLQPCGSLWQWGASAASSAVTLNGPFQPRALSASTAFLSPTEP